MVRQHECCVGISLAKGDGAETGVLETEGETADAAE
jgi:hypothetical protein